MSKSQTQVQSYYPAKKTEPVHIIGLKSDFKIQKVFKAQY